MGRLQASSKSRVSRQTVLIRPSILCLVLEYQKLRRYIKRLIKTNPISRRCQKVGNISKLASQKFTDWQRGWRKSFCDTEHTSVVFVNQVFMLIRFSEDRRRLCSLGCFHCSCDAKCLSKQNQKGTFASKLWSYRTLHYSDFNFNFSRKF